MLWDTVTPVEVVTVAIKKYFCIISQFQSKLRLKGKSFYPFDYLGWFFNSATWHVVIKYPIFKLLCCSRETRNT